MKIHSFVLACVLALAVGCKSIPVKQTAANVADTIAAVSATVLSVQQASHTAALAIGTPAAIAVDVKVQTAAKAYGQDADVALAKVKQATSTAEALVAGAPVIAEAQKVLEAFGGKAFAPGLDSQLSKLAALLASLKG